MHSAENCTISIFRQIKNPQIRQIIDSFIFNIRDFVIAQNQFKNLQILERPSLKHFQVAVADQNCLSDVLIGESPTLDFMQNVVPVHDEDGGFLGYLKQVLVEKCETHLRRLTFGRFLRS
jgi:hypothetical protein